MSSRASARTARRRSGLEIARQAAWRDFGRANRNLFIVRDVVSSAVVGRLVLLALLGGGAWWLWANVAHQTLAYFTAAAGVLALLVFSAVRAWSGSLARARVGGWLHRRGGRAALLTGAAVLVLFVGVVVALVE